MRRTNETLQNPSLREERIVLSRRVTTEQAALLTPPALRFVAELSRRFRPARSQLLALRQIRQKEIDAGTFPAPLVETQGIREADWTVSESGFNLPAPGHYTADFEDGTAPSWYNCLEGHLHVRRVMRSGPAGTVVSIRPRAWHLDEPRMQVDGDDVPASLFDLGLFLFHSAAGASVSGMPLMVCLPKIESHLEARLWREVIDAALTMLSLPLATVRTSVLIETVLAAFEIDEIIYELGEICARVEIGARDFLFSMIKRFRNHVEFVVADGSLSHPEGAFAHALAALIEQTCRRRHVRYSPGVDPDSDVDTGAVLTPPEGAITEAGLQSDIETGIRYLAHWCDGEGTTATTDGVIDTAGMEVARARVWQRIRHGVRLDSGVTVDAALVTEEIARFAEAAAGEDASPASLRAAVKLFTVLVTNEEFPEFVPPLAYGHMSD